MQTFTPAMLGAGKPLGGGQTHRKQRKEDVNPLAARGAEFLAQGKTIGHGSLTRGTSRCAQSVAARGNMLAEQMQHLSEALAAGEASALVDFMARETERTLKHVLALRV